MGLLQMIKGLDWPGFGFKKKDGKFVYPLERNQHIFNVFIGKDVEIGPFTCIDKGSWRNTTIDEGTKIDSHVKIAHNVRVGKHCLIVAGAVIGGSCEIGDYCFIGMNASIRDHIKITNNVTIGMGAVVVKDIDEPFSTWIGNPAHRYVKDRIDW